MRKIIKTICAVALISMFMLVILVSCDNSTCLSGHYFEGQEYLSDGRQHWQVCKNCNELSEKMSHTPADDDGDCTTEVQCSTCGFTVVKALEKHNFDGQNWRIDTDGNHERQCVNCEYWTVHDAEAKADDGNCLTAVSCKYCPTIVIEAKSEHDYSDYFVNDDGEHESKCSNCDAGEFHIGVFEVWTVDSEGQHISTCTTCAIEASHTAEAVDDDGNCTTDILCKHCDVVITKGAQEHSYTGSAWSENAEGNHQRQCTNCDYFDTHTAESELDDGDCTTPVKCQHCDITVPAKEHSYTGKPSWSANGNSYTATYFCDHTGCTVAPKKVVITVPSVTGVSAIVHDATDLDSFSFTVKLAEGYRLVSVKADGIAIEAVEGVYSANIAASTISIEVSNLYTVTYLDKDGNVIATEQVAYGDMPNADNYIPEDFKSTPHLYTFTRWNPSVSTVTGDVSYKAQMNIPMSWYGSAADSVGSVSGVVTTQNGVGGGSADASIITGEPTALRHDFQKSMIYRLALQVGNEKMFDITQYENIMFKIAGNNHSEGVRIVDKNGNLILTMKKNQVYTIVVTQNGFVYVDGFLVDGASMSGTLELYICRNETGNVYCTLEYTFPKTNVEFTPYKKVNSELSLGSSADTNKLGWTSAQADSEAAALGATTVYTMSWSAWSKGYIDCSEDLSRYNEIIFYVKASEKAYLMAGSTKLNYKTAWTEVKLVKSANGWTVFYGGTEMCTISALSDIYADPNGAQTSGATLSFTNLICIGSVDQ